MIVAFAAIALNAKGVSLNFANADSIASYGIVVPEASYGTNLSETPFTVDGITFSCVKVAKTDTRIWNSSGKYDLRTYANNTITLTSDGDNIVGIDVAGETSFAELTNGYWEGDAKSVTLTATASSKISHITVYTGEAPVIVIDTFNVAQMNAMIDDAPNKRLSKKACVIGRVTDLYAGGIAQYGNINVWLADIRTANATDTIEAYGMLNYNGVKYTDEAEIQFGIGDTIVIYSGSWDFFEDDKCHQYEASKGCSLAKVVGPGHPKPIVFEEITVEEAIKIAKALAPAEKETAKTAVKYDVRGYVVRAHATKENVWFLADDLEANGDFQAYQCTLADGSAPVEVGAYVSVIGYIENYNGGTYNSYDIIRGNIRVVEAPIPPIPTIPTVQDVAAAGYDVANARVICLYFDEQVCNDIVWVGSYNGWNTDSPADMLHFEPLEGFAGWYVVEVYDESDVVMGKPVQLKKDGSFNWDFQSGDAEAWINMSQPDSKTASIVDSYLGEADCTWPENGAYIYELAYWKKHNTPCVTVPTHDYTFTVYLPEFCDEIAAYADSVFIMGGFDWNKGIKMERRYDYDFNLYYYAEIKDLEEGTEFKFRCGTMGWDVQPQLNGADLPNMVTTAKNDTVIYLNGEGYGFKACAAPVGYKYTEYENWQIKYGPEWVWTENMTKVADGLYAINIIWAATKLYGFNIKSDDNPIKQDWYALDDPAVTVADGLVEGEPAKVTLRIVDDKTLTITIDVIPEEISVAEALAIAQTLNPELGKTLSTSARYDVRGYVVEISSMGAQEKFYLADSPEATYRNFQVYKCTIPEGAVVEKGSYVSVVGYISNYKGGTYNSIGIDFGQLTVIKLESVICVTEHGTSTGAGKYLKGETCTLTVTPDYGYHFVQWTDSVTDNPRSFIVTQDTTFTAVFAKNQYLISVEAEHGVVSGGGYYEYQSYAQLSATAGEHYHFVKWSDENTSNPRTISVTEDKTYTAIFALDQFTISATATHGAVTGTGKYDYGQEITLTVVPDFCYEFAGWNDGNTDNPRKVTVLGDAQYSAQCKQLQMANGSCGNGVYWALDLQTGILTISGDGAMDNYTSANQTPWYGYLSFTTFSSLIIEDGVTHIGNYAFYGLRGLVTVSLPNSVATIGHHAFAECQDLEKVAFGAGLQSIGDYAFYNDIRIEEMTCLASRTPDVSANTFGNVSHFAWVYVQSEYFHKYEVNMYWNVFVLKTIEAEPAVVQEDDVTVTPSTDNATIVWPSDDAAAEYTLEITKDGVVFCTLRFNAQGQLIGIAFAPSRDGELRTMSNAEMTVNGWSFTVTGLNPGSTYSYTVDVVDAQKQSIHQYTGSFTTTGGVVTSLPTLMSTSASGKMLYNGHLYILRDGNLYTATGARVK